MYSVQTKPIKQKMASTSLQFCILTCLVFFVLSPTFAKQSFRPKALLLRVTKDASTLQYTTQIEQRTPLVPINLVVHLGGQYMWVDCDHNYVSTTYRPVRCGSALCSLAGADGCGSCSSSPKPGCNKNTCGVSPANPITHTATSGELATDVVSVNSTNGSNPGPLVTVSRFLFSCAPNFLLNGLASGAVGIAGLGRTKVAIPSRFASAFSFPRKFAICLSSTGNGNGVIFFGDGPYNFLLNAQLTSQSLTFTKLYTNPVSTASAYTHEEKSAEYFIGVNSIKINDKTVPLNNSLLKIDREGRGGTKISTVDPYTVLQSSIFHAVTKAFIAEAASMNISKVASVAPFHVCFSTTNVFSTRLGAAVPTITLVLEGENVEWSIFGANSMVQVSDNVLCLGLINGGRHPRTSIVIGGYQLENNLVQFDLAASRLGFSSLLFGRQTTCSDFNFTSIA